MHLKSSEQTRKLRLELALRGVEQLRQDALEIESELAAILGRTSSLCRESAHNLAHYLAVRQVDIRPLQQQLSQLGLSSLGTIEAHVMASLNAVLQTLHALGENPVPPAAHKEPAITFNVGKAMLERNTEVLFGSSPECVMLNKGPYINRAVQFLCDVLGRMQAHHKKGTATLRQLSIADLQWP